ncbi:MAG: hypothetical protein E7099_03820 [Mediterranea massiliensis]|nr:hypothetical protein [Mediterranea massiliensis]
MENRTDKEKVLRVVSHLVSAVFAPGMLPFVAFLILFTCSYLRIMPLQYRLIVLGIVFCFTLLLPMFSMYIYRKLYKLSKDELRQRHHRFIPFLLVIFSYVVCLILMVRMHMPWYLTAIVWDAMLMLLLCTIINLWWRLSIHMAGIGAIIGGLVTFSMLFGYNPMWWLCFFILTAGMLGSARMILYGHSFGEVLGGFAVGMFTTFLVLHPVSNIFFSILFFM